MEDRNKEEVLNKIQLSLNAALTYWLYESLLHKSLKKTRQLRRHLSSSPLLASVEYFNHAAIPTASENLLQVEPGYITDKEYANVLASLYRLWELNIPDTHISVTEICQGIEYNHWLTMGGAEKIYGPVHMLRKLLSAYDSKLFKRAVLHGSLATLDDREGFSDMDLALILDKSALKDAGQLLTLRQLATKILAITLAFDPFMHHGPYYISEIDLAWYPEAMFPTVLFSYAVDLLDSPLALEITSRDSANYTDQMVTMFENFFHMWAAKPFELKNYYDVEWVLGSAMLLPALYLQRKTGVFRYKRDTFDLAEKDFSDQEWEPIKIASKLRLQLGSRPKPSPLILWIALKIGWPGLLQHLFHVHPLSIKRAKEVTAALGDRYPHHVLNFLNSMKFKLNAK